MPSAFSDYVATPISVDLRRRMETVHQYRSIAVLSGPPGIGKTTTAGQFLTEHPGEAVLMTVPPAGAKGMKPVPVAQLVLDAIWEASRAYRDSGTPKTMAALPGAFRQALRGFAGAKVGTFLEIAFDGRITLVLDEAQNLARESIELLRYLNDEANGWSPVKVGLVFLGNNEFALEAGPNGESTISSAVRSRSWFVEALSYQDVSLEDFKLLLEPRLEIADDALELALQYLMRRSDRCLRKANHLCIDLIALAGDQPISREHVAAVTGLI